MADLTITPANVVIGAGAKVNRSGRAGTTVTAGQQVYLDPSTQKYLLADNNSATAAARVPSGTALNGAALNQPLAVLEDGDVTIGATLVPGTAYYLSDTPGGICPFADLAAGEFPCVIGIAKSASVLRVKINASGVSL